MKDEISTGSERSVRLATAEAHYPVTQARISVDKDYLEVKLTDCEFMASQYPETFQRPTTFICDNILTGMILKVIVEWPLALLPQERFWVEVTQIHKDANGHNVYFGELRNRTFLADYGEKIGPIYPKNIADVDIEAFIEKYGLADEETTTEGVK